MSRVLSPEEALERALRAQEGRTDSVRVLVEARQAALEANQAYARELAEAKREADARVSEAEGSDVRACSAGITAGWLMPERHKIGYGETSKKRRAKTMHPHI